MNLGRRFLGVHVLVVVVRVLDLLDGHVGGLLRLPASVYALEVIFSRSRWELRLNFNVRVTRVRLASADILRNTVTVTGSR